MKIPHLFKTDFTAPRKPARLLWYEHVPVFWLCGVSDKRVILSLPICRISLLPHVSPGDKELPFSNQTQEICLEQARGQPGQQNLASGILARKWFDLTFQKL